MELSPLAKVLLIMNNYFHDVATAFLFTSALMMLVMYHVAKGGGNAELRALGRMKPRLTMIARAAIAWIVIGGIPRTIFYNQLEYPVAEHKGLLMALGAKHGLMFALVVGGVVLWTLAKRLLEGIDEPRTDDGPEEAMGAKDKAPAA